ncbi:MAG: hypothetical protein EOP62_14405 [Sphingomonadales bacterium]|nr:MAG: hypothetical protein EOP62_14405 [Sphingomonadales bacterium]
MSGKRACARRGNAGWQRRDIAIDGADRIFRGVGFDATETEPVEAWASFDRQNRMRRVHARWACGWRATLQLRLDGTGSLSSAKKIATITLVSDPRGAA